MRRIRVAIIALATAGSTLTGQSVDGALRVASTGMPSDVTWLALGDSYSSGEGLPNPDIAANPPDTTCERATGASTVGTPSRAWAVVASDLLRLAERAPDHQFRFVACTGDMSDDWAPRWTEAGAVRADLVTMSYGGNNIGFGDVVLECVGLSVEGGMNAVLGGSLLWGLNPALGCSVDEAEMKRRIDVLVGNEPGTMTQGELTLPRLYEQIARTAVNPGGHVIVTGYPNLVEESARWTWRLLAGNRCHRIRRADAAMFRSVAGYLNEQTALAVQAADGKHNDVHFHWVDTSEIYENSSTGRHGLCTGSPWLNGLTIGTSGAHSGVIPGRVYRSFHPNQDGHDRLGAVVAELIDGLQWEDLERDDQGAAVPEGMVGEWSGVVTSSEGQYKFEVQLALDRDGGTIWIPDGSCDGRLVVFAATDVTAELRADEISGNCIPGDGWRLTIVSPEVLRYEWFGPDSARVDAGDLKPGLPGRSSARWPTEAGLQGPSALYIYMGSELLFPDWVSCTDDENVCIAGAGSEVRVYATDNLRFVTSLPLDTSDPAGELRSVGATDTQIAELLSP